MNRINIALLEVRRRWPDPYDLIGETPASMRGDRQGEPILLGPSPSPRSPQQEPQVEDARAEHRRR